MMSKPRIVFFGYSEVGYVCLQALLAREANVVALITHEDDPKEKLWFKVPATVAREHRLPTYFPDSVNTPEWKAKIAELRPDLILSVYYRDMISMEILNLAPLGAFNLHGSLLPKFRGRAPVNWAVIEGATETGMSLHRMVKRPDAGAIVDQEAVAIESNDTAEEVFHKLLPVGRRIIERQIDALLAGTARETPQDDAQATYFGRRRPEDGRIKWTDTTKKIFNLIRGVTTPFPGAFAEVGDARLMVWWAEPVPSSVGVKAHPGEVIALNPLTIATADGTLRLVKSSWVSAAKPSEAITPPALQIGHVI